MADRVAGMNERDLGQTEHQAAARAGEHAVAAAERVGVDGDGVATPHRLARLHSGLAKRLGPSIALSDDACTRTRTSLSFGDGFAVSRY